MIKTLSSCRLVKNPSWGNNLQIQRKFGNNSSTFSLQKQTNSNPSIGFSPKSPFAYVTVFGHFENYQYEAKRFARSRRELIEREVKKRYLKKYHPKPEPRVTIIPPQPVLLPSPNEARPIPSFQQKRSLNENVIALLAQSKSQQAHEAFQSLLQQGASPAMNTFAALMQSLALGKEYEKAISVFEQSKGHGSGPNLMMFTILLSFLSKNGDTTNAEKYFQQLSQFGLKPHVFNYNSVLAAYATKGDTQSMWKYFKEMESNNSKSAQPDKTTIKIMLDALQQKQDPNTSYILNNPKYTQPQAM